MVRLNTYITQYNAAANASNGEINTLRKKLSECSQDIKAADRAVKAALAAQQEARQMELKTTQDLQGKLSARDSAQKTLESLQSQLTNILQTKEATVTNPFLKSENHV